MDQAQIRFQTSIGFLPYNKKSFFFYVNRLAEKHRTVGYFEVKILMGGFYDPIAIGVTSNSLSFSKHILNTLKPYQSSYLLGLTCICYVF